MEWFKPFKILLKSFISRKHQWMFLNGFNVYLYWNAQTWRPPWNFHLLFLEKELVVTISHFWPLLPSSTKMPKVSSGKWFHHNKTRNSTISGSCWKLLGLLPHCSQTKLKLGDYVMALFSWWLENLQRCTFLFIVVKLC